MMKQISAAVAVAALSLSCTYNDKGSPAKTDSDSAAGRPAATSTSAPASRPAVPGPSNEPVHPFGSATTPKGGTGNWLKLHNSFVARAKAGDVDVVFLGDSITFQFRDHGFASHYANLKVANFGIGGDRTENILWRLDHGELDGISPKVVVLLIGTNNLGHNYTVEDTVNGVGDVVRAIQAKSPTSRILLMGIFPRWNDAEFRQKIKRTNKMISGYADGKRVRFLDIGDKFLEADGKLTTKVSTDYTHLTGLGYEIWTQNMDPVLYEMLDEPLPAK
jgi:lysophospholipase L1-like esterase